MEKRQSLIEGAFILVCANVLVKIIGAIFKIPLTNLIGASGMGDFSVAYNLYVMMFVISTAGLPVAISKMVSEANALDKSSDIPRIIKCALVNFCTLGFIFTCALIFFADEICIFIGSETAYLSILSIAPSIFLITIVSILRGYYQGHHNMNKTAISQLIEAVFKLLIGYFFAKYLIESGYDVSIASAGAIFGVTVGTLLSAIYLCINILFFRRTYNKKPISSKKILNKKLLNIAIPITIGASVLSLTSMIDMFTIMRRLQSMGVSASTANDLYGAYNMAMTLYSLPQTLITAISISIIPIISEIYSRKNKNNVKKIINSSLFMSVMIAMPCSVGFVVLSKPILDFLYYKRPQDVLMASPILVILGLAVVFVSVVTITNASMQAISKPFIPVKSMAIGLVVKLFANVILISIPSINISGAPMSTVLCFFVISVINLTKISQILDFKIDVIKVFMKPVIASVVMGISIVKLQKIIDMSNKSSVLIVILIGAIIYFSVLLIIKGINKEDIGLLTNKRLK